MGKKNEIDKELLRHTLAEVARAGMSPASAAPFFGFKHPKNFIARLKKDPELQAIWLAARAITVKKLRDTLLRRAFGYDVYEQKAFVVDGIVEVVELRKHIIPDITAIKMMLMNTDKSFKVEGQVIAQDERKAKLKDNRPAVKNPRGFEIEVVLTDGSDVGEQVPFVPDEAREINEELERRRAILKGNIDDTVTSDEVFDAWSSVVDDDSDDRDGDCDDDCHEMTVSDVASELSKHE